MLPNASQLQAYETTLKKKGDFSIPHRTKEREGKEGERERERERKRKKEEERGAGDIKKSDKIPFITHPAAAGEHYGQQSNQIPYHQCVVPS
jgi:hypothetical protein